MSRLSDSQAKAQELQFVALSVQIEILFRGYTGLMVEHFSKRNLSMVSGGDSMHKMWEQGCFKMLFSECWKVAEVARRPDGFLLCSDESSTFRNLFSTHCLLQSCRCPQEWISLRFILHRTDSGAGG